ncbi:uncharacterized protein LOC120050149 [Salvelinus namaycush]|uniref:Uncharacterized protein LOC120050149 n=1 Tax=Salvelinus namaycush TaxID=8040 RepID=A0A8U0QY74_SALNM|nr:uncharacterized protein LOC120050149 [Salvelinus namaycush]
MGNSSTNTASTAVTHIFNTNPWDLGIDHTFQTFFTPNALDNLNKQYNGRKQEVGSYEPIWTKSLVTNLGGLTRIPKASGFGALIISIVIDIVTASIETLNPEEDSTDILRRVFAEEKASTVYNEMEEALKRCTMNINNEAKMKSDIVNAERRLSFALTTLKNSMLDGHMKTRSLKIWVNGAAFHVQLLIHLARLEEGVDSHQALAAVSIYQKNLEQLLLKYNESKSKTIVVKSGFLFGKGPIVYDIMDEEIGQALFSGTFYHHLYPPNLWPHPTVILKALHDDILKYPQIIQVREHFREVRENLAELISQREYFILS